MNKWMIRFPAARAWVMPADLTRYAGWKRSVSDDLIREVLRHLKSVRVTRTETSIISSYLDRSSRIGCEPGWCRFPTDGTRMQVFDPSRSLVAKLTKCDAISLTRGIEVRRIRSHLPAPEIVAVAVNNSGLAEKWVREGGVDGSSLEVYLQLIHRLKGTLYETRRVTGGEFQRLVGRQGRLSSGLEEVLARMVGRLGWGRLPVSLVHGDLTVSNISVDATGSPVALDWEYCRECLVTYDCWLYRYQDSLESADCRDQAERDFFRDFGKDCRRFFGDEMASLGDREIRILHCLHLMERMSFLAGAVPETTTLLRRSMHEELCRRLRRLNMDD